MKTLGIVEVGSTNTKAYKYENGAVKDLGFKNIEFRKNYDSLGYISEIDIDLLASYINSCFDDSTDIYVYGTSIFRFAQNVQGFEKSLLSRTKIKSFEVVSIEDENKYTVMGAIKDVSITENICVYIGGGGSTEISICKNGEIIEEVHTSFGVTDIKKIFPDLSNDLAVTDIEIVSLYAKKYLNLPKTKARYMILAGGDFILRCKAGYPTRANNLFISKNHPLTITYKDHRQHDDRFFHEIKLSDLAQKHSPDNPRWWDGARANCAMVNVVAKAVDVETIFPTKIAMVYGILDRKLQISKV